MTLGKRIKELRRVANLSLRELGKRVGTDFTYLSKIENDKYDSRPPSEDLLAKLARVLGTDENELLILAERIPDDAKDTLLRNKEVLSFFRSIKGKEISPETWGKLMKEIEKSEKNGKPS